MIKLDLLNRLIQEPDNLDLELLELMRAHKFNEDSFKIFMNAIENNYEMCVVSYFYQGMQTNLWHAILDPEQFVEFSSVVLEEFSKSTDFYTKKTKITLNKFLALFSEQELVDIAKFLIKTDTDREGAAAAIFKIYQKVSDDSRKEIFKYNVEESVILYFKFKEYEESWNDLLPDGTPLYFEYFNKALLYNEVSFKDAFKVLIKNPHHFDFNLNFNSLNFCEFITQKLMMHFSSEVVACISKDFFSFIEKMLEKEEFKDTCILIHIKDNLLSLDPKVFPFILSRWNLEKETYSDSIRVELLQQMIVAFYDSKIAKHFVNDFNEIVSKNPDQHLLDVLEIYPQDFEIYDPWVLLTQFKDLKLEMKSKNLTMALQFCIDLAAHDCLTVNVSEFRQLRQLLHEEPHNYLYLDYTYLKAISKVAINKQSESYFFLSELIKDIENYKQRQVLEKVPEFLKANRGFKIWLKKTNLMESGILNILQNSKTEKNLVKSILGTDSAYAHKLVFSSIITENEFNYSKLYWAYQLTKSGFNYDRVTNFIMANSLSNYILDLNHSFLSKLKLFITEDKILSIILNSKSKRSLHGVIKDTYSSLDFLIDNSMIEIAHEKVKSSTNFNELHDQVSIVFKFLTQPNFLLDQSFLYSLDGVKIKDYRLSIPQYNHDLINLGKTLHICVGDGQYGLQIKKKRIFIVAIKSESGKYSHCVEIDRNTLKVKQAKTYHNKEMSPSLVSLLLDKISTLA